MKWMDIWPVWDKTKASAVIWNKNKKNTEQALQGCAFSLDVYGRVFFFFLFFKNGFSDSAPSARYEAAFKAATTHLIPNSHILPSLRMTSQRLSDTNRHPLNLALNKQLFFKKKKNAFADTHTHSTHASICCFNLYTQFTTTNNELSRTARRKKEKKLTDVCGPGDIVLRMHP